MHFHYELRKNQREMMEKIQWCIEKGENIILQAATGSGKTICALFPSVGYAVKHKMRILYLTRTNSQQRQAILELKAMKKEGITGIGFQGRRNMCLLAEENPNFRNGGNEEISRLCSTRKKRTIESLKKGKKAKDGCSFFANIFISNKIPNELDKKILSAEEVIAYCKDKELCPYEISKKLVKKAMVVVAPYIYLFDPFLQERLREWNFSSFGEAMLIIDEAHNLPEYCRRVLSHSLSLFTLKKAVSEADEYEIGDKDIIHFCKTLAHILSLLREKYVSFSEDSMVNDALVPLGELEKELRKQGVGRKEVEVLAERLVEYGDIILDIKENKNMLPRSYLRYVGTFLFSLLELDERWIKVVVDETGKNPRLEYYCLDASIASSVINEFYASIHMSGTLFPLEEYRDSLAIKNATLASFPSPFPKENKKVFYMEGMSTKYEEMNAETVDLFFKNIVNMCNSCEKNTAIFFPSYAILERFLHKGLQFSLKGKVYIERRDMGQRSLMRQIETFKKKGGIFLSVIGGRISEGMDFPSDELEMIMIVGIPYPPPSARQKALQRYYEKKYGNGWKYAVEAPTTRKLLQAIGRLIRDENDKGIAIILDERAKRFKKYIEMEKAEDIVKEIHSFWET